MSTYRPLIIKVCGMTQGDNILTVEALGVDWLGFIFFDRSPRCVRQKPNRMPQRAKRVGVFVNASLEEIRTRIGEYGLHYVQLHGDESPSFCLEVQALGVGVIKAFPLSEAVDLEATMPYEGCCNYYLFDTKTAQQRGGSGMRFNWQLLDAYRGANPFLLSGGIGPESLDALRRFEHPLWAGIDLNSRFESAPGVKALPLLAPFIHNLKSYPL